MKSRSNHRHEPLSYAERLHRLTVAKVAEKLEAMAAELAADREGQKRQDLPARTSQPIIAATED